MYLCQMLADFKNSFTIGFIKNTAIKLLSCYATHLKNIATLSGEM